jgi:hypothetical protein
MLAGNRGIYRIGCDFTAAPCRPIRSRLSFSACLLRKLSSHRLSLDHQLLALTKSGKFLHIASNLSHCSGYRRGFLVRLRPFFW